MHAQTVCTIIIGSPFCPHLFKSLAGYKASNSAVAIAVILDSEVNIISA